MDLSISNEKTQIMDMIKHYGTSKPIKKHMFVEAQDINLTYYPSLYFPETNYPPSSFRSMINFFQDLF